MTDRGVRLKLGVRLKQDVPITSDVKGLLLKKTKKH